MSDDLDSEYLKLKKNMLIKTQEALQLAKAADHEMDPGEKAIIRKIADEKWEQVKEIHQAMNDLRSIVSPALEQKELDKIIRSSLSRDEKKDLHEKAKSASNVIQLDQVRKAKSTNRDKDEELER